MIARKLIMLGERICGALALSLAVTLLCCSSPVRAQSGIGSAAAVKNDVTGVRGSASRNLAVGGSVFSDDAVKTGDASLAQLLFLDQTTFSIAANSQAVLKNVYHPQTKTGQLVLNAVAGAFRYVSGVQANPNTRINFPFGYLTVRGTIVDLLIWPTRDVIILDEGAITVVPYATGVPYNMDRPGTYLIVYKDGHVDGPLTWDSTIMRIAGGDTPFPLFGRTIYPTQQELDPFNNRQDLNDIARQSSSSSGGQVVGVFCPAPGVIFVFNGIQTCSP
jgi:hypothetical protein